MDWSTVLGAAAVVMALASAAGLGLTRSHVSGLREARDDLQKRVDFLEKERAEIRAELVEVKSENKLLDAMVKGKVEWVAISDLLEEHHRQALQQWTGMNTRLDTIHADLGRQER